MIQPMLKAPELARRIIAAQQRHRQLFEYYERQTDLRLQAEQETIPSMPSLIVRAVDWPQLSDVSIWNVARSSPSFVPRRYDSLPVISLPPVIGFGDDDTTAAG
jgi:hypothetical protein